MAFTYDPARLCQKLRCKEMLIHVDDPARPEEGDDAAGVADGDALFDPYDAVAYWCECTQTGRGPDGERVHLDSCSCGTSRRCFVGIESIA